MQSVNNSDCILKAVELIERILICLEEEREQQHKWSLITL